MTPAIVTRSEWGAPADVPGHSMSRVSRLVVHTYWRPDVTSTSLEDEIRATKSVDDHHRGQGWGGYGYNWGAYDSGRIHEGRGRRRTGAHTRGMNSKSIGLAFGADGTVRTPSDQAVSAAGDLVRHLVDVGDLAPDYAVDGHRDHAQKGCPGDFIYELLGRLRGLSPDPANDTGTDRVVVPVPVVDMAETPSGEGYWQLDEAGGVFTFGDARFYGSIGTRRQAGERIPDVKFVSLAATSSGGGYFVLDEHGGVHTFGDARYRGSVPALLAEGRIPSMPATPATTITADPDGDGYWVLHKGGDLYAFDARFRGRLWAELK